MANSKREFITIPKPAEFLEKLQNSAEKSVPYYSPNPDWAREQSEIQESGKRVSALGKEIEGCVSEIDSYKTEGESAKKKLDALRSHYDILKSEYGANPSSAGERALSNVEKVYNETLNDYKLIQTNLVGKSSLLKQKSTDYLAQAEALQKLQDAFGSEYDAWKSTVRSPEEVQKDIDWWSSQVSDGDAIKDFTPRLELAQEELAYSKEFYWQDNARSVEDTETAIAETKKELDAVNEALRAASGKQQIALSENNAAGAQEAIKEQKAAQAKKSEIESRLKTLDEELSYSKKFRYNAFPGSEDFDEYVELGKKQGDDAILDAYRDSVRSFQGGGTGSNPEYAQLTDDERNIYYYLFGKEGKDAAEEYIEYMRDTLTQRSGYKFADKISDVPVIRELAALGIGIDSWAQNTEQFIKSLYSDELVPKSRLQYADEKLSSELGGISKYTYGALKTTGNMLPSIATSLISGGLGASAAVSSALSLGTMGAGSYGGAYTQAINDGYTPTQARTYGVLVGASEVSLQYLLGGIAELGGKFGGKAATKLMTRVSQIDSAFARIAAKVGIEIGGEIAEEEIQLFLEPAFRSIIFGEEYDAPEIEEMLETAVITAISTAMLSSGNVAIDDAQKTTIGKGISADSAKLDTLLENALAMDAGSEAYKLAEKIKSGEISSNDTMLGELYCEYVSEGGDISFMQLSKIEDSDIDSLYDDGDTDTYDYLGETEPTEGDINAPAAVKAEGKVRDTAVAIEGQRQLASALAPFGSEGKRVGLEMYDTDMALTVNESDYHSDFARFYNMGEESEKFDTSKLGVLSEKQARAAYEAGNADTVKNLSKSAPGLIQDDYIKANWSEDQTKLVDTVAKKLGVVVRSTDSVNFDVDDANISGRVITIERGNANPINALFGHEIAHHLKALSPKAYSAFEKAAIAAINIENEDAFYDNVNAIVDAYKAYGRKISRILAEEEVLADFAGELINNGNLLDEFIRRSDRSAIQKFFDAVSELYRKVADVLTGKERDNLEAARKKLIKALETGEKANKKAANDSDIEKSSVKGISFTEDKYFARKMDNWESLSDGTRVKVGEVREGSALALVGLPESGMYFDVGKIKKAMNKHSDHLSSEVLKKIPDLLNDPVVIAEYKGAKNTVNVYGDLFVNGKPVVVGVVMSLDVSGNNIINKIRTVYVRSDISKQITDSSVLYINENEKRTRNWFQVCGNLNVPLDGTKFGLIRSISYVDKKVNENLSTDSDRDITKASIKGADEVRKAYEQISKQAKAEGRDEAWIASEKQKAVTQIMSKYIKSYGALEKGENPARDIDVPSKTEKNKRVSQTVRTILEAEATPDVALPKIEELIAKGEFSREAYSDKAALDKATKRIKTDGFVVSLHEWLSEAEKGKISKDNVALGWELYNNAVNSDDVEGINTALKIVDVMIKHQRSAAQALQATRILKKLSPEGMLYHAKRSIMSMEREINERYAKRKNKKQIELKINEELAKKLLETEDETERIGILEDIYRDIGRQMPASFMDKWNAWRYMAMLCSIRTHIKNIGGNTIMTLAVAAKDIQATAIEAAVDRVSRARGKGGIERTKGFVGLGKSDRAILSAAFKDYEAAQSEALGVGKYGDFKNANKAIEEGRVIFKFKPAELMRKAGGNLLDSEDIVFSSRHYAYAMAQYCKANGISAEQIEMANAKGKKITHGMSDAERYAILKEKSLALSAEADSTRLADIEAKLNIGTEQAELVKLNDRKKLFKKLGEEFGVFKKYENSDIELSFNFSKGNMGESTVKQSKNYKDFAKMFTCFDDVIENAIGIEIHNRNDEGYKVNKELENVYVLVSAFSDGDRIVPVKLEIKEFKSMPNALYVAIALESIKIDGVVSKLDSLTLPPIPRPSNISLSQLFGKVNPRDKSFVKYVPKQFFEKIPPKNISQITLDRARTYAIKEAQKATFRDANAFSDFVSSLGRSKSSNPFARGLSVVSDGYIPFRRTNANVAVRGLVEYNPIGLIKGLTYDLIQVSKGEMSAAEAIDNIAAGLTGTEIFGFGVLLAAQGLVRGRGGSDEDKREFEEMLGHQAYSLELPDGTSITLDWLAPASIPFFVGVNMWETMQEANGKLTLSDVYDLLKNMSLPMLEMSCLQGINDIFDTGSYARQNENNALIDVLINGATNYFIFQIIPTLLGQIERTAQSERMTTYTTKNSFLNNDWQYTLGKVSSRIPGWDFGQIPYIDAWGRTESTGSVLERVGHNMINPAYTDKIEVDSLESELLAIYDELGEGNVFPKRASKSFEVDDETKYLTADEYVEYAKAKGQTSRKILEKLITLDVYKSLDTEEKAAIISRVYEYSNAVAKMKVSDYDGGQHYAKAIKTINKTGIDPATYLLVKYKSNQLDVPKGIDYAESLLEMQVVYSVSGLSDAHRKALFDDLGVSQDVRHYGPALVNERVEQIYKQAARQAEIDARKSS